MSYSILKQTRKKHIFKLFIGWKGLETVDVIYWVTFMYKLIIYRLLDHNKISVIEDNTFMTLFL
jgi:hypothetical protein